MPALLAPPRQPALEPKPSPTPAPAATVPADSEQPYKGDRIALLLWLIAASAIGALLLKDLVWGLLRLW